MRHKTMIAATLGGAAVLCLAAVAGGANVVPNPGFEADCSGVPCQWTPVVGPGTTVTLASDDDEPHSGALSLRDTVSGPQGGGAVSGCVPFSPGPAFASVWYRTADANVSSAFMLPHYYADSACDQGAVVSGFSFTPTKDGQWHLFAGSENVAPPETVAMRLVLTFRCNACQPVGTVSATTNFDDVSLSQTPTAVAIASFQARRSGRGVLLRWRTAVETGTLGFNVFREVNGRQVKLNPTMIPSVFGGTATGPAYSWLDRSAPRGRTVRYRLQAVHPNGRRNWVGATRVGLRQLSSARSRSAVARCRPSQFRIADHWPMVPPSGQNPHAFVLVNRGPKACMLDGYPAVVFLDAHGRRLPFRISHSGDQMVTSRRPVAVRVAPGRSALFLLNKYRCDRGTLREAKKLRVGLPGVRTSARLTVALRGYGYCGQNDPGSVVAVSPIVPTLRAALAY